MIPAAKPLIGSAERRAVDRVLVSGRLAQGPEVEAFEQEFAQFLESDGQAIAVSSGTTALHLALVAAGIGRGDEVILPSFSFAATANAVVLAGAVPVFADISPSDFCLAPNAVRAMIGPRTAAIIPVHLYGHPAAIDEIREIASAEGLLVIEDAAQAHGAAWKGQAVGTFGHLAAFSFYPTKNMTTGEGGMVMTSDAATARTLRLLRNQGMEQRYNNEIIGHNARMTEIAAALGRVQLTRLPGWLVARRANAETYDRMLSDIVELPRVAEHATHAYHQYTVRVADREDMEAKLTRREVGFGVYYPTPIHRLPAFDVNADLPETERACREVLSLPIHPGLSGADLAHVVSTVCS